MKKPNYKQIFARQKQAEKVLLVACPNLRHESGIYFLTREEENVKYAYIGKGVDVLNRMCSHLQGYAQRIDISLRKRGFFSKNNELGWKLNVLYFPKEVLDEKERFYIEMYKSSNVILYNIESGGTTGKEIIGERKAPKTYHDGLKMGDLRAKRRVQRYFDKYLDFNIKPPINKVKERKLDEFVQWLQNDSEEE